MAIRVLRCGPIYFFMTPVPGGPLDALKPPESNDLATELIVCGPEYFAIVMTPLLHGANRLEREKQAVRTALQHTWNELVRRGVTSQTDMPEPIPVDMMRVGV